MFKAVKKWGSTPVNTGLEADEDESGIWHYLVVDVDGIRSRESPLYSKETKRSDLDRIKEGTILEVSRRRRCGWTRWLQVSSACHEGWVFDVSPKDKTVRLVEVEKVTGHWQYQAMCDRIHLLPKPSPRLAAKPGRGFKTLESQELFTVKERLRPINSKGSFLRLADGRGYVLDFCKGRHVVQRWLSPSAVAASAEAGGAARSSGSSCDLVLPEQAQEPGGPSSSPLRQAAAAGGLSSDAEHGDWTYIVLDAVGMSLRALPRYSEAKLATRLAAGDLVKVVERRIGDGTTYLRLEEPVGWAFDVEPCGGKQRQRMMEVTQEHGMWYYRVCAAKGIALRSKCCFADSAKIGKGPSEGALLTVVRRVRVGDTTFLRTRDDGEGGWIFDRRGERRLVEGPISVESHAGLSAVVQPAEGVYLRSAPTGLKWACTKRFLLQGARVQVSLTCEAEGHRWCRVSQQGGMSGWIGSASLELETEPGVARDAMGWSSALSIDLLRKALTATNPLLSEVAAKYE